MTTPSWTEILSTKFRMRERDEYVSDLTVRVCCGSSSTSHRSLTTVGGAMCNSITIELTSESDVFLYYSLRMSEVDFHSLKSEQRLLVDFSQFSQMLRELLTRVKTAPQGMAVVFCGCEEPTLSIMEANQFRELVHLSLRFRPGSEDSVRSNLVNKMAQLRATIVELEKQKENLQFALSNEVSERGSAVSELKKAQELCDHRISLMKSQCASDISQLKEEHARELCRIQVSSSAEITGESKRLFDQLARTQERLSCAEKQLEETRVNAVSWETRCRGAERKIESLEMEIESTKSALCKSETDARDSACKSAELEKRITQCLLENSQLKNEVEKKDFALLNSSQLAEQQGDNCKNLENSVSEYRASLAQCQNRIEFLEKALSQKTANVGKMHQKLKEMKTVAKSTQEALLAQESLVKSLEQQLSCRDRPPTATPSTEHKLTLAHLQSQLADANQVIQSNSQVIDILSKKLNSGSSSSLPTLFTPPPCQNPPSYLDMSNGDLNTSNILSRHSLGPIKFTARNTNPVPLIK